MKWNLTHRTAARSWLGEARRQFRLIQKLERPTADGDVEALHDLRVSIRRLRVLLRALEAPLSNTSAATVARRWQQFTRNLSPLRDTDVWRMLLAKLPVVTPAFRQRVFQGLDQPHSDRTALMRSRVWSRLKRDTQILLTTEIPAAFKPATKLDRALRKAWKQGVARATKRATARPLTHPEVAHEARIACRHVRYLAEFFAAAATREKDRTAWLKIAKRYQAAQQALGQTHDTDTLLEFLHAQRLHPPAKLLMALTRRRQAGLTCFRKIWRDSC